MHTLPSIIDLEFLTENGHINQTWYMQNTLLAKSMYAQETLLEGQIAWPPRLSELVKEKGFSR